MPKRNKDRCALGNYKYISRDNDFYWLEYKSITKTWLKIPIEKHILMHLCVSALLPELPSITLPTNPDSPSWYERRSIHYTGLYKTDLAVLINVDGNWIVEHVIYTVIESWPKSKECLRIYCNGTYKNLSASAIKKIMEFIANE